jgi:hypothetical protein
MSRFVGPSVVTESHFDDSLRLLLFGPEPEPEPEPEEEVTLPPDTTIPNSGCFLYLIEDTVGYGFDLDYRSWGLDHVYGTPVATISTSGMSMIHPGYYQIGFNLHFTCEGERAFVAYLSVNGEAVSKTGETYWSALQPPSLTGGHSDGNLQSTDVTLNQVIHRHLVVGDTLTIKTRFTRGVRNYWQNIGQNGYFGRGSFWVLYLGRTPPS